MNRLGNRLLFILLSLLLVFPCFWIDAKPTAAVTLDLQIWFQGGGGRATLNYEARPADFQDFLTTLETDGCLVTSTNTLTAPDASGLRHYEVELEWTDPPGCSFTAQIDELPEGKRHLRFNYGDSLLALFSDFKPETVRLHVPGTVLETTGSQEGGVDTASFSTSLTPVMDIIYLLSASPRVVITLTLHPTESPTLTESSTLGPSPELLPFDAQLFYREDGSGEGILFVRLLPGEDINGFLAALADDTVQVISQKEISAGSWELEIQWEEPSSLTADVSAAGGKTQLEVAYAGRGLQYFLLGRPRGAFVFFVPGQVSETNGLEAGENAAKFAPDIEPMRVAYLPGILPTLTESALPSQTASATALTPSSSSSESGTPSESATPPTEQNDFAPSESAILTSESFRETLPAAHSPTTQSASLTSSGSIPTTTSTTPPPPAGFQLWLIVVLGVGILLLGMLIAVILMGRKRPPQPPADLGSTHRMDSAPPPSPSNPLDASQEATSDSRFCGKCGSKLDPDKHFCPGCGTPVA